MAPPVEGLPYVFEDLSLILRAYIKIQAWWHGSVVTVLGR